MSQMHESTIKSLITFSSWFGGAALVCLNVAYVVFLSLWSAADSLNVNRMEEMAGYDVRFLLPHSNIMWVTGHLGLVLLIVVDVCAVVMLVMVRKRSRAVRAGRASTTRSARPQ